MLLTFDLETDGLLDGVSRVHCGAVSEGGAEPVLYTDIPDLLAKLSEATTLVGHNIIGYDLIVLWKLHKWKPAKTVKIVDTFVLSMLVHADIMGGHGLAAWGTRTGVHKTDYLEAYRAWRVSLDAGYQWTREDEWAEYNSIMGEYCQQDVRAAVRVYDTIRKDMGGWDWDRAEWMEHEFAKLFARQAWWGVAIDVPHCQKMVADLSTTMALDEAEIAPKLPTRQAGKGELNEARPPKACFKLDGTPGKLTLAWFDSVELIDGQWHGQKYGQLHKLPTPMEGEIQRAPLTDKVAMNIKDQAQIKAWLMDLGWIPTGYNYQKRPDKYGKQRIVKGDGGEPIPTAPKFHDKGVLCPNLERMITDGSVPSVAAQCVRWIVLRHRRGIFQGLLDNLRTDGTVGATGFSCGTPTSRVTHAVVCNIPKADKSVLLGYECRAAFIARPGRVLMGADAAGLELRCLAARVDSEVIRKMVMEGTKEAGTDIHSFNAKLLGVDRNTAKLACYSFLYGSGDKKLGASLGGGEREGAVAREKLERGVPGLEGLLSKVAAASKRGFLRALDGRRVGIRSPHAALNTLLQSDGSLIVKWATVVWDREVRRRKLDARLVVHYHDEILVDCKPEHAELAGKLFVDSLRYVGKKFGYACPLGGSVQIGSSWAEVH